MENHVRRFVLIVAALSLWVVPSWGSGPWEPCAHFNGLTGAVSASGERLAPCFGEAIQGGSGKTLNSTTLDCAGAPGGC